MKTTLLPTVPRRVKQQLVGCGAIGTLLALLAVADAPRAQAVKATVAATNVIRIGIAPGTWGGVNRSDATAAISAWAKTILQQRGLGVQVETTLFETDDAMSRVLKNGRVDAVSMLAHQFLDLEPQLQPKEVFLATHENRFTERYVLLVHRASGIDTLAGLKGGRLLLAKNARASLAPVWLDTLLASKSLEPAAGLFKSITRLDSTSKVILQVFFRQAEACVISTNAFQLATELNPQLQQELRVLAVSPEVVPSLFYFRPGHASRARELLEPAILSLQESLSGRQVLTVFQCDQMIKLPASCLDGTRELLAEQGRLQQPAINPLAPANTTALYDHASTNSP